MRVDALMLFPGNLGAKPTSEMALQETNAKSATNISTVKRTYLIFVRLPLLILIRIPARAQPRTRRDALHEP